MNIVVLDGYALNPGDLSWSSLDELGTLTVYDRTPLELITERALEADLVLTNKTPLTKETLEALPRLKYIGVLATGYNVVDGATAAAKGIPVANIPCYGTGSVAQYVFALLLELCNRVGLHSDAVLAGEWTTSPDFCFTRSPLIELEGKTMGIVGYGRIGSRTAQVAQGFGMRVVAAELAGGGASRSPSEVERLPLEQLLAESDVVSLHCPQTPETQGMIHRGTLACMKRSALLVNTSRGGLIIERDLADALNQGIIAGAALDVLNVEPPVPDNPLFTARNIIITPHIAWATKEARSRLLDMAVGNAAAFLRGERVNVVNGL